MRFSRRILSWMTLGLGVLLLPSLAFAASDPLSFSGVSAYAVYPDSGVVDYDYGNYGATEARTSGLAIADADRVSLNPSTGAMSGYAWHTNSGWLEFGWTCPPGETCADSDYPVVDLETGEWSGYTWSDTIGWIWFDWSCPPGYTCDTSYRVTSDLETGEITGYGWSDAIGWISFGGGSTVHELPSTFATVQVRISPDPTTAVKYDAEEKYRIPFADGYDEYEILVYVLDEAGDPVSDADYSVGLTVKATADSYVCFDQVQRLCANDADTANDTEAVFFPYSAPVYDSAREVWVYPVRSLAPTSNANGYDEDGNGVIDYFFDIDPDDAEGLDRSGDVNRYAIDSFGVTVTPSGTAPVLEWESSDDMYGLTTADEFELAFVPPIEVLVLERWDGSKLRPNLHTTVGAAQSLEGYVVQWSDDLKDQSFKVRAIASVDSEVDYTDMAVEPHQFLFDIDNDGDVTPGAKDPGSLDDNEILNQYSLPSWHSYPGYEPIDGFATASERYVPAREVELLAYGYASIGAGSSYGVESVYGGPASIMNEPIIWEDETVSGAFGNPEAPRIETRVVYTFVVPSAHPLYNQYNSINIRYYSNYLPQGSGATNYYEDIEIEGSITSTTGESTGVSSSDEVVVIGDISTLAVRNELYRRYSELTKGVNPDGGIVALVNGDFENSRNSTYGVSLMNDTLLFFEDVEMVKIQADGSTEKTIVVEGGNIFIQEDISDVGIVAFKDVNGDYGNVYIDSQVTDLENVYIFAEGSIFAHDKSRGFTGSANNDGPTDWGGSRASLLNTQLYFNGSIVSFNTIHGADSSLNPKYILPDGTTTSSYDDAREYDLNKLREFSLCWKSTDIVGSPADYDGDGSVYDASDEDGDGDTDEPDPSDVKLCGGSVRSATLSADASSTSYNVPALFEYTPPPADLPILGGSQAGNVNVLD